MSEIYEVKTSLTRQSIYTGIGQLLVHSAGEVGDIRRVLMLPEGYIPNDLARCIRRQKLSLRRFKLVGTESLCFSDKPVRSHRLRTIEFHFSQNCSLSRNSSEINCIRDGRAGCQNQIVSDQSPRGIFRCETAQFRADFCQVNCYIRSA
jgi:hypothetical protein